MQYRMSAVLLAAAAALWLAGCGGGAERVEVVPVSGKLYVDDQPHGPAMLVLHPAIRDASRPTASARVAADGSFVLTTYEEGDGAAPGEYQATLMPAGEASSDPNDPMASVSDVLSGSGTPVEPTNVTIPPEGATDLEIRMQKTAAQSTAPGGLLGQ